MSGWTPERRERYEAKAKANRKWRQEHDPEWRERRNAAARRRYKERMATDPEFAEYRRRVTREWMAKARGKDREHFRELSRRWFAKWKAERPLDYMLYVRAQYEKHREKRLAYTKALYAANVERYKAYKARWRQAEHARCAADADYYAVERAKSRMRYAQKRIAQGKTYRPLPQCRIPDSLRMGEAERLAARSAYSRSALIGRANGTSAEDIRAAELRGYARALRLERRAAR